MEIYIAKLKHILPTFFLIALSTIIGLSLFRWLFVFRYSIIDIKEEFWDFYLPIVLPWIPLLIWLQPRLKVLTFKPRASIFQFQNDNSPDEEEANRSGRLSFLIIAWGTITASLLFSQNYFTTATGKLQQLSNIKEIDKVRKARYYKLTNFAVGPYFEGLCLYSSPSGYHNKYLDFDAYCVTPILNNTSERSTTIPKHWFGVTFHEQISNEISDEEKEEKYQAFYAECIQKLNNYDFHSSDHFERIPTSYEKQKFIRAIQSGTNQTTVDDFIVLVPIQEKFEVRNGNEFAWIFGSFAIGLSVLLLSLNWPEYSEPS